jgi:type VI secretion system protein ImpB
LPIPPLDRLMWLRNALVALNGPLAGEPGLRENLQQHLFNEETDNRVLGKLNPPVTS